MVQFVNRNLLCNALKFSPAGTSIKVDASEQEGLVMVSVTDSGPGIGEHLESRLFQIGTGDGSNKGGAGILYIVVNGLLSKLRLSINVKFILFY